MSIKPSTTKVNVLEPRNIEKFVKKGWGYEKWITNTEKYCGKLLFFEKGKKLSYHVHRKKTETFYLYKGKLILRVGWDGDLSQAREFVLKEGDVYDVPVGLYHQMEALEDSELFEFSTQHFDEDSYRAVRGD